MIAPGAVRPGVLAPPTPCGCASLCHTEPGPWLACATWLGARHRPYVSVTAAPVLLSLTSVSLPVRWGDSLLGGAPCTWLPVPCSGSLRCPHVPSLLLAYDGGSSLSAVLGLVLGPAGAGHARLLRAPTEHGSCRWSRHQTSRDPCAIIPRPSSQRCSVHSKGSDGGGAVKQA